MSTETLTTGLPRAARLGDVVSLVWRPRPVLVSLVLAVAAFAAFCVSVRTGDYPLTMDQVLRYLVGIGDRSTGFIIGELRLPRATLALIVGGALAMSGAIVQSIARNPLASPDILGITGGAGAVAVLLLTSTGTVATAVGGSLGVSVASLVGGLATGLVVYALVARQRLEGTRLILVGIAVTALMQAATTWMIVRADIDAVGRAQAWLVGSLEDRTWDDVTTTGIVAGVAAVVAMCASFSLRALRLGDDVAVNLGVSLGSSRSVLLLAAVVLAAISVAGAGPIAFVAFVAPQVAVRLTGLSSPPLIPAALTGATLLSVADLIARGAHIGPVGLPTPLPVGIVTAAVGGPFLVYLLVRQNMR